MFNFYFFFARIWNLLNETEKLSLLPDRYYLILKPRGDGSFDVIAYDTTDPAKPVDATFYVLKGLGARGP